jgi:HTH-type transcriptional regulator, sugar sensing transcriptional regulator
MIDRLVNLGLSSYEATAYLTLLKRGEASPVEVALKAKIPKQRVYDVLSSLHSKGFCLMRETTPKSYAAVDPAIALTRFRELEAEAFFESESIKKAESRRVAEKLAVLFEKGRVSTHSLPTVEILKEENMIASRMLDLMSQTEKKVSLTMRSPLAFRESLNNQMVDVILKKELRCRVLADDSFMADDPRLGWIEKLRSGGCEVRHLSSLPVKLSIFDDQAALLAVPQDESETSSYTGVIVSHSNTVEFLGFAFEQLWVQSSKLKSRKN